MPIQRMRLEDISEVSDLYLAANTFSDIRSIRKWTLENFESFARYQFVWKERGVILGAISGNAEDHAHIDDLAVREDCRGRGVGAKLLTTLLTAFRKDGLRSVSLWVHKNNEKAIQFYIRHGFQITKKERTNGMPDVPDGEEITHMLLNL